MFRSVALKHNMTYPEFSYLSPSIMTLENTEKPQWASSKSPKPSRQMCHDFFALCFVFVSKRR
ncbi:hypothetical protein HBI56_131300 [Parastagonospora nodorum]|uniref:Uncharacterized protein n=1 Tax=Phaeosphaeria nodorum (strain SN15 / ATCC MYA-4574 / FGSC 10173) TaxID=321614 RepID=A0A7U2EZR8_PHANO|nr:hypothetical protein HBH56_152510 [Parastagonospora nodorum]QRC96086.1 hypothetical protein JI435_408290 [Parastagonospora nodorum SN15]KAH3926572.1 hypothetical protein HBH54_165170 [Parastagonospora nodorum]KAH3940296.1 hypothetical protein HBH53_218110 [Parastagonospora nodorum]KAH3970253.1 hypothetical protein HBH52_165700 [Parastagonospora nodorum]